MNLLFVNQPIAEVNSVEKKVEKAFTDIEIPEVKISESKPTTLGNISQKKEKRNSFNINDPNILEKTMNVWKRVLGEIFIFYSRLQKNIRNEASFDTAHEKVSYMSLGEWIKFCLDFDLIPSRPHKLDFSQFEPSSDYGRTQLINMYKREAKGNIGLNYLDFEVR